MRTAFESTVTANADTWLAMSRRGKRVSAALRPDDYERERLTGNIHAKRSVNARLRWQVTGIALRLLLLTIVSDPRDS